MNNADIDQIFDYKKWILHRVKFWLLLALQIPAFFLSLLIFYFYLKNQNILRVPQNRSLLILFTVNFTQVIVLVTISIHFYAVGSVSPATPIYCTLWTYIAYTSATISGHLMATISVQQHMFIFHSHVIRIQWKRILLHYLPLIFFLIYPPIFYAYAVLIYPCDGTQWDYTTTICGLTNCYLLYDKLLVTYDWLVNVGSPMVINALANALLIIRVIYQKRQQQRRFRWREQRRMTIQLFCISSLYLVCWTPSLCVGVIQLFADPTFMITIQADYFIELTNLVCLFLPWICIGLLPQLKKWVKNTWHIICNRNVVSTIAQPTQLAHRTK